MQEDTKTITPVNPVAAYIGGKRQLASRIVPMIERVSHSQYAEPFIGMGGIFLRRTRIPRAEVINDISADVSTFFRVIQRHYVAFMDLLRYQFTSRHEFARLLATPPDTLTDLERAVRFIYLQRLAFGGKVTGRNFGVSPGMPGRFDVTKLERTLDELSERLSAVVIENLNYAEFIERYDTPDTLFYLDPPYFGSENDYGKDVFAREDFQNLADQLKSISGHFIMSINDTPEIRDIFSDFNMEEVELNYTIASTKQVEAKELIITPHNLPLRPEPQGRLML